MVELRDADDTCGCDEWKGGYGDVDGKPVGGGAYDEHAGGKPEREENHFVVIQILYTPYDVFTSPVLVVNNETRFCIHV